MAYTINKFSGEKLVVLEDGTIDTSTSLGLVGRNYVGYGETQNENFVFLLENFANDAPPSRPLQGQIWFNTLDKSAYVYDGEKWSLIGSAVLGETAPANPNVGSLWLRTPVNTLNVWNGTTWSFIGPEAVPGFGTTRARSGTLLDSNNISRPVIFLEIDSTIVAVCTNSAFTINTSNGIPNLSNNLIPGINLTNDYKINGSVTGNAGSATKLETTRLINGVAFDGQQNIVIKSSTTNKLVKGTYIVGSDFDGSIESTWSVDATPSNIIGKVVARNSEGGFSASTITANLVGNVLGDVKSDGTSEFNIVRANQFVGAILTGNAFSASQLETPRTINGVRFDGTQNITIAAAAETLTGNTLNSTVTTSSLTRVGTLAELFVADSGATVGSGSQLRLLVDSGVPTLRSSTGRLNFDIGASGPDVSFVNASTSVLLGGPNAPALIGDNTTNLGINGYKFNNIYANNFLGNATSATTATTTTNIAGGGLGSIPVQTSSNTTSFINLGSNGFVLRARPSGPNWEPLTSENLNRGTYLNFVNTITSGSVNSFDSSVPVTISVDATTTNTADKIVARDGSGNFAAGTITANLIGNVNGNVNGNVTGNLTGNSSGTHSGNVNNVSLMGMNVNGRIQWPADPYGGGGDIAWIDVYSRGGERQALRLYVNNDGPGSVEDLIELDAAAGVLVTRGNVTSSAPPTIGSHLANKDYVDSRSTQYRIISGASFAVGFTNIVNGFSNSSNYFDVFPPAGKNMSNLVAFIPSVNYIAYAGTVNGDDVTRCTYAFFGDRIRVYVQNTEQRATPAANYLVIWS